jgi:hypothetical protein
VRGRLRAVYRGRGSIALLPKPDGRGTVARLIIPSRPVDWAPPKEST